MLAQSTKARRPLIDLLSVRLARAKRSGVSTVECIHRTYGRAFEEKAPFASVRRRDAAQAEAPSSSLYECLDKKVLSLCSRQ